MLYSDCSFISNPKIHILYQKEKKNYHHDSLSDYYVQSFIGGEEEEITDSQFIAELYLGKEEFAVMTSIDS